MSGELSILNNLHPDVQELWRKVEPSLSGLDDVKRDLVLAAISLSHVMGQRDALVNLKVSDP